MTLFNGYCDEIVISITRADYHVYARGDDSRLMLYNYRWMGIVTFQAWTTGEEKTRLDGGRKKE